MHSIVILKLLYKVVILIKSVDGRRNDSHACNMNCCLKLANIWFQILLTLKYQSVIVIANVVYASYQVFF